MSMTVRFTLEYWKDDDWYVGRLREVPGVFSQGKTLKELEDNIRDAYELMVKDQPIIRRRIHSKPIAIPA
jgi:predicted RNase H-like HicB family nuclease